VSTAENRIVDPSLHEYYDKLLIVTTGPIFTMERFRTIWRMNTGAYAGLIEQYVQRNGR
jgi:arabinofuranosyltransferase